MKTLTEKEYEIMNVLWQEERLSMKDIQSALPEPRPHFNTLSTVVRRLEEAGYINHRALGARFFLYEAAITRREYEKRVQKNAVGKFFNGSYMGFVSQLVEDKEISVDELKELIRIIEENPQEP